MLMTRSIRLLQCSEGTAIYLPLRRFSVEGVRGPLVVVVPEVSLRPCYYIEYLREVTGV